MNFSAPTTYLFVIGIALVSFGANSSAAPSPTYGDIIMNRLSTQRGIAPVVFSHAFHRIRFRCNVCHDQLGFVMQAGANEIDMAKIVDGQYCGACHNGEIAPAPSNCDTCHSAGQ